MRKSKGKGHGKSVISSSGQDASERVLRAVLGTSIMAIREVDGRVSGLKFNKLAVELYWMLSKARNRTFHFVLPHRWYLYGAVVDDHSVMQYVRFDHPDNELETNVEPVSDDLFDTRGAPEGLREEIESFARDFALAYAGQAGIAPMLKNHYRNAPLPFQRAFLEWSQLTRAILYGYEPDAPRSVALRFDQLIKTLPSELEPRLASSYGRLALYLEPMIKGRSTGDLGRLREAVTALWDFWAAFCLFLSIRYNAGLPPKRLEAYRKHAETELAAYKRRLSAYLESGYLEEEFVAKRLGQKIGPLSRFMAEQTRISIEGDEWSSGSP